MTDTASPSAENQERTTPAGALTTRSGALRVSLVEDELLVRRLLERLVVASGGRVVHSLGGFAEARLAIGERSTDVVVVDVNLGDGDGIDLAAQLQQRDPHLGILVLSSEDVLGSFMLAQEESTKPWSYLSKRSSFATNTFGRAILAASVGEQVIDPYLIDQSQPRNGSDVGRLTAAQFRVLALIAEGLSNEAIADRLGIAVRSVENHLLAVYRILGVANEGYNRRVLATLAFLQQTSRRRQW